MNITKGSNRMELLNFSDIAVGELFTLQFNSLQDSDCNDDIFIKTQSRSDCDLFNATSLCTGYMVCVDDSAKCCRAEIYADNNKLMYREIGVGTTPTEEEETKDDNNQSQKKVFGVLLSTSHYDHYYYKYYVVFAKDSIEANEIVLTKILGASGDYYKYDIKEIDQSEYGEYGYIGGYQESHKEETKVFGVTVSNKRMHHYYIAFAEDEAEAVRMVKNEEMIGIEDTYSINAVEVCEIPHSCMFVSGYN